MFYISKSPTIANLNPVVLAALLVLPFVAWGQSSAGTFAEFESAIQSYNSGATDVTITVTADFAIASLLTINNSAGKTLTIKSDGTTRTLTRGIVGNLFTITGVTLIFENIIIDGYKENFPANTGSLVFVNANSVFEMREGTVLRNNKTSGFGGGVTLEEDGSKFIMTGGKISENIAIIGGGVDVEPYAEFTMSGGEISGNTASYGGGGVSMDHSTFTMSGGNISGNDAQTDGGGVYLEGGTFTMNGGEISDNTAPKGSGVYVGNNGIFTMSGGNISGNDAQTDGGGVYVGSSTFTMTGGEISGNTTTSFGNGGGVYFNSGTFTVGGTAKIFGNTTNGASNNVRLFEDKYITLGAGGDAPQTGMQIRVSTQSSNSVIVNSGATENDEQYFYADQEGKAVVYENNQLVVKSVSPIPTAQITLTAPALGATPNTAANGTGNFTVGSVAWSDSPSIFLGKAYTATVTLTAESGYSFTGLGSATINGQTATVASNTENTLTLSYAFPAINIGAVTTFPQLRAAILTYEGTTTGNTITIGGNFDISEMLTIQNSNITITSGGGATRTLTRGIAGNLFTVQSGTLIFENIIIDGDKDNFPANIRSLVRVYTSASFEMREGAVLRNNKADEGGGVYVGSNGTFTMSGGEISENIADDGGGVLALSGTFTMTSGTISGNTANYGGGGAYFISGTFTMSGGTISGNNATGYGGGGVLVTDGDFTMSGGEISKNITESVGGGVYVVDDTFTLSGGEISGNTANNGGGGVYVEYSTFTMSGGTISENSGSNGGGVIVGDGGTFTMKNGTISGNSTDGLGGGVYGPGIFIMEGGTISENTSGDNGAGVNIETGGEFTMNGGTISKNITEGVGGGVYVDGTFTLSGGNINENIADNGGGGIFVFSGTFTMTSGNISGNTAVYEGGGGIFVFSGTFTMTSGNVSGNSAADEGGGVWFGNGTFTMSGTAEVSGNTATYGGGVYVTNNSTFTVGGTAKIKENKKSDNSNNNVYLPNSEYITLGTGVNAPADGMEIWVTATDGVIVNSGATENDAQYFYADEPGKAVAYENNQLVIKNSITTAQITLTAPALGATPSTTATGTGNFTVGSVAWIDSPSIFLGGTQYTATVTLTALSGYAFQNGLQATINGQTATVASNTGGTVTLSYQFPPTDQAPVNGISITAFPSKLIYTHGEQLDLSGLAIQLNRSDGSTENIAFGDFGDSIKVNISGQLSASTHNGAEITVQYRETQYQAQAGTLTVEKANLTITADNKSVTQGGKPPEYTATYSGFANGEDETVLTGTLEFDSDYTPESDVGEYDIIPHGLSSGDYEITFVKGVITVVRKDIIITLTYKEKTINFDKDEELSTENKTFLITNNCEATNTEVKITATDPDIELNIVKGELNLNPGIDTLVYNLSKGGDMVRQDTTIIVSPLPFDKIIKQKWGLLIANSDPSSNGGYKFAEYNWFKNGDSTGTTLPYYRLEPSEKLNPANLFNVQLTTQENIKLSTCEGSPTAQQPPEQQSVFKKQVLGINGKTASGKVYNIKGNLSTNNVPPGVYITEEKR